MKKIIIVAGIMTASMALHAGDLKAPFLLPSAKVLPKGVRNLRYNAVLAGAENKYGANSQKQALATPLNSDVTFAKVLDGKLDPVDKGSVMAVMNNNGYNEDTVLARTTGQVNISATAHVPVLAWGLTKKLTIAAVVPVVESDVNFQTGVVHVNKAAHEKIKNSIAQAGASPSAPSDEKLSDVNKTREIDFGFEQEEEIEPKKARSKTGTRVVDRNALMSKGKTQKTRATKVARKASSSSDTVLISWPS
jgi:hypothetical protein